MTWSCPSRVHRRTTASAVQSPVAETLADPRGCSRQASRQPPRWTVMDDTTTTSGRSAIPRGTVAHSASVPPHQALQPRTAAVPNAANRRGGSRRPLRRAQPHVPADRPSCDQDCPDRSAAEDPSRSSRRVHHVAERVSARRRSSGAGRAVGAGQTWLSSPNAASRTVCPPRSAVVQEDRRSKFADKLRTNDQRTDHQDR
jgi:hypothetical protein